MQGMRKTIRVRSLVTLLLLPLLGCTTTSYQTYLGDFLAGRESLRRGEYKQAKQQLESAAKEFPDVSSYAFLATAYYKIGDTASAAGAMDKAKHLDAYGTYHLRIIGYSALIDIKEKGADSTESLKEYLAYYKLCQPLMSMSDVEDMIDTGIISLMTLEGIMDTQIRTYEDDSEQYQRFHTGFYDRSSRRF